MESPENDESTGNRYRRGAAADQKHDETRRRWAQEASHSLSSVAKPRQRRMEQRARGCVAIASSLPSRTACRPRRVLCFTRTGCSVVSRCPRGRLHASTLTLSRHRGSYQPLLSVSLRGSLYRREAPRAPLYRRDRLLRGQLDSNKYRTASPRPPDSA
jgi:hypothetical protein